MNEKLLKIPALLSQACAAYPGGKRGVFRAIESAEGRTLSESTFYAALNSNPTGPDALKVSQLVSVMRVTADISALRYLAAMFGQAVVPLDAGKPDAPTVEGEMLQDYPAVVRFHEVARRYQAREVGAAELLQAQEMALAELRQTTAKVIEEGSLSCKP